MIILAWIIVALFLGFLAVVIFPDLPFALLIVGTVLGAILVIWAEDYIVDYYSKDKASSPASAPIAQSSTNWMGVPITTWGTNDETLQLGLAPNGSVVWRRVDTNIWYKAKQL